MESPPRSSDRNMKSRIAICVLKPLNSFERNKPLNSYHSYILTLIHLCKGAYQVETTPPVQTMQTTIWSAGSPLALEKGAAVLHTDARLKPP
jgi:hypothetical protein